MKKYLLLMLTLVVGTMVWAGDGSSKDDPYVLTESGTLTFPSEGWGHFYCKYTATADGKVVFSSGNSHYFDVVLTSAGTANLETNNQADIEFDVTTGNTYTFDLGAYLEENAFKVTLPGAKLGSFDNPFTLTDGASVDLGTAAGTFWATYTSTKEGKVTFAGNPTVTAIKVYESKDLAESGSIYKSVEGSSVTVDVLTDKTYYVSVDKGSVPTSDKFTCTFAEYAEGEVFAKAIALTNDKEYTVAAGKTMWYKYEVAQGKDVFVGAKEAVEGLTFDFYSDKDTWLDNATNKEYNATDAAVTAYLKVANSGTEDLKFTGYVKETYAGETMAKAIEANNPNPYTAIVGGGKTVWYFVTIPALATKDVKVEADETQITVCDANGSGKANGTGSATYTDKTSQFADKLYIKVDNTAENATDVNVKITVSEHEYAPGEDKTHAIDVTSTGVYTFDDKTTDVWVKYTASKSEQLEIASDLEYSWNTKITYDEGETEKGSIVNEFDKYSAVVNATVGTTYYVHASLFSASKGKKITFKTYVPEKGSVYTDAKFIYKDEEFNVPAQAKRWFKFEATSAGYDVTLTSDNIYVTYKLYQSETAAAADASQWVHFYDFGDGPSATPQTVIGVNYLVFLNLTSDKATFKLTGNISTGINEVNTVETAKKAQVFNLAGQRVSNAKGVVIMNGKKVVR